MSSSSAHARLAVSTSQYTALGSIVRQPGPYQSLQLCLIRCPSTLTYHFALRVIRHPHLSTPHSIIAHNRQHPWNRFLPYYYRTHPPGRQRFRRLQALFHLVRLVPFQRPQLLHFVKSKLALGFLDTSVARHLIQLDLARSVGGLLETISPLDTLALICARLFLVIPHT